MTDVDVRLTYTRPRQTFKYSHDSLHRERPEIGFLLHNPSRKWLLLFLN
jgi:hypothetical protein